MLHNIEEALASVAPPAKLCFRLGWGACCALLLASLTASMLLHGTVTTNIAGTAALAQGCIEAAMATFFVTLLVSMVCNTLIKTNRE